MKKLWFHLDRGRREGTEMRRWRIWWLLAALLKAKLRHRRVVLRRRAQTGAHGWRWSARTHQRTCARAGARCVGRGDAMKAKPARPSAPNLSACDGAHRRPARWQEKRIELDEDWTSGMKPVAVREDLDRGSGRDR